jgi:phosphoketolase
MPLPGERLVAFLSDGAFEEQKGGDWAPRWWRAQDSGLVAPIMIANGRRIDQRTTVSMEGGVDWFREYLKLNGFEPLDIDGRDPAAYAWAIWEMEERLGAHADAIDRGTGRYPVPLPYAIAEVPKGYGFPGAGTNAAHNLPLGGDVCTDADTRQRFNAGARQLWVPAEELQHAVECMRNHDRTQRPPEREHPLAVRKVAAVQLPEPPWHDTKRGMSSSPMRAMDEHFCEIVKRNPQLRVRVGNPDEIRSNRLDGTLDLLRHRVTDPEPDAAEAVGGRVITALNEEAVVCAALANKGGINLVATYEAFAVKMLGAVRQEIIFARHQAEVGHPPGWLSVPVVPTSHTWENGKNEISHQDPTFCEALLGEMSDTSKVLFPADSNSAVAALQSVYRTLGQIWTLVTPKRPLPEVFTAAQAGQLANAGALPLHEDEDPEVLLIAVGGYQLQEVLKASACLSQGGVSHKLIYMMEPGRFRYPRDDREAGAVASRKQRELLFPELIEARVFVGHVRPESLAGVVRPLDTGPIRTRFMGYLNRGGTFDAFGMLYANRCTWGHVVAQTAEVLGRPIADLLGPEQVEAVEGRGNPECLASLAEASPQGVESR